jgi:hypothetical protein
MQKKHLNSTAGKFTVLRQLCNLIPTHLVGQLAAKHGSESQARTFSHWSHVVALLFAKVTHAFGLNDTCDTLAVHSGPLSAIRRATPPTRRSPEPTPTPARRSPERLSAALLETTSLFLFSRPRIAGLA